MTGKRPRATESRSSATAKCQGYRSVTAFRSIPRVDGETMPAQPRVRLPSTLSSPDKTKDSGCTSLAKPGEALPRIPLRRAREKIGCRCYPLHHSKHPGSSVLILTLQGESCRLGRSPHTQQRPITGAGSITTDHFRTSRALAAPPDRAPGHEELPLHTRYSSQAQSRGESLPRAARAVADLRPHIPRPCSRRRSNGQCEIALPVPAIPKVAGSWPRAQE